MDCLMDARVYELNNEELLEIDGGVDFLTSLLVVGGIVGSCGVIGFAAGCVYELVLGE